MNASEAGVLWFLRSIDAQIVECGCINGMQLRIINSIEKVMVNGS